MSGNPLWCTPMRPRRLPGYHGVFRLVGGTEDNDLFVKQGVEDGTPFSDSVWELDDDERSIIADGGTIELRVYGVGHPPVSLVVGESIELRRAGTG